ncbi:ANTAR domain-containing protein [Streptomyces sp. NPDC054775]|uniref:ANTAR domain-containing protein n=1 Tax=Streptomyces sp. NPDC092129 TaxID=3366010 RepID=UPI00380BBD77
MIQRGEHMDRVTVLQQEVEQLRSAVVSHALIDQAIGAVVTVGGLRPEQGWEVLKHISQHTDVKLREVARVLVQWPADGPLPEVIRRALPRAVDHVHRTDSDHSCGGEEDEEAVMRDRAS